MKPDPKEELPEIDKRTRFLAKAVEQSAHVEELVAESAEVLSSVNVDLKQEAAKPNAPAKVESALRKSEVVAGKIATASDTLDDLGRVLEDEIRDRNLLHHQFAAVTEQEKAFRHAALHDVLTSLPNRALFNDRLEHGLMQAERHGWIFAVMFVDLDRFKSINDSYGHDAGDAVLQTVARRLLEMTRGGDTVGRLGGDEFLYLAMEIRDEQSAAMIAEKIIKAIEAPCHVSLPGLDFSASIGASIGISLFPRDGTTADALIRSADEAMYQAKRDNSGHSFSRQPLAAGHVR